MLAVGVSDPGILWDSVALAVSFAATFATAYVGSRFTFRSLGSWYAGIRKPAWAPSGRTIGTIWSVLYFLMAVAAWLVWRAAGAVVVPLGLFAVQLALNAGWSWLFFGRRNPCIALAEILVLWMFILATLVAFWTVSWVAGLLFVPYLVWVTFASFVNLTLWRMNR